MNRFCINIDHVSNPELLSVKATDEGSKTLFLSFCMHATGIRRLFDKDTIQEFLYRLAITFRHHQIIDKFFLNDELISYKDRKVSNELILQDVIEHLGLELWDGPSNLVPREEWQDKIETYWVNACKIAVFTGMPILDRRIIGLNKFVIGSNKPTPITPEFEKIADLFAREGMKTIGDKAIEELKLRVIERCKYLEKYRAHLATKPKHTFNYMQLPLSLRTRIYAELYPNIKIGARSLDEEINEPDSTHAALVYLAWLWVNGYVSTIEVTMDDKHTFTAEVDERIDFDYEKYEGLNCMEIGTNIYETYHRYGLERIAHLLKKEK